MPLLSALFFLAIGGGLVALGRARDWMLSGEAGLEYEDDGNPAVRTLGLSER